MGILFQLDASSEISRVIAYCNLSSTVVVWYQLRYAIELSSAFYVSLQSYHLNILLHPGRGRQGLRSCMTGPVNVSLFA